jgi:CheY-like chemotaxis protein
MAIKKQLLGISELDIKKRLIRMSSPEFDEYVRMLNVFVEEFPAQEARVKKALEERDYTALSRNLGVIKDTLAKIHADSLVADCVKQMNGLNKVKHEKIEAFLAYFLSVVTMLSIDIQMAVIKNEQDPEEEKGVKDADKAETDKGCILAVDDSAFSLGLLKNILRESEYKLTCVTSGNDALKFLRNHRPSLFILDIEMPQLDGYELAEKIKESGHKAPIIFLTANATKEYVVKAVNSGGVDFIVKPPEKEYVLARIAKHIY